MAGVVDPRTTLGGSTSREARVARLFASPASVLIIVPALVIAVGLVVLLLGRRATRESTESMARHQLLAQAVDVSNDVKFALGQAEPVLSSLRQLAEPALPTPDAAQRMRDVVVGRPGIANATIVFPIGVMWGTFADKTSGELMVHETRVSDQSRVNYRFVRGEAKEANTEKSTYDPIGRPQYQEAVKEKKRVWLPPRTFSTSHKTGVTVAEPVYAPDGTLTAVVALDFDVAELSKFIRRPPLAGARTVLFTEGGTILAYPSAAIPEIATQEKRLLRYTDFKDPALDALFAKLDMSALGDESQRFLRVVASDGAYLCSVAVVTSRRTNSGAPLEAYLATLVPESTLFGATQRLNRTSIIASAAAVAIALGVALMFAWNLVRMRRAVAVSRAAAKSAEERAAQLGSYRLVERLGQGGMGEVWRAEHQLLARHSAIKLVRRDVLADPAHSDYVHERFRREAQTLASLRSRHTIELYDYGVTDDGSFFFVMELLEGVDLAQLVRAYGPQSAARVISILSQACSSLSEAHDAGLLHRDIKPANLFLTRAADEVDIVKLLDFGIVHNVAEPIEVPPTPAKALAARAGNSGTRPTHPTGDRLTTEGVVIGTPGYIPPEQAIGGTLDARGDLYALACVGWWLLVGEEVFPRRSNEDDVLKAHVAEPVPMLRDKVRGWMPQELEDLIFQCLEKDPANRPANARALADALDAIEIPPEHAWTRAKAVSWWSHFVPAAKAGEATTAPIGGVVVARADAVTRIDGPQITAGGSTIGATPQSVAKADLVEKKDPATVQARRSRS